MCPCEFGKGSDKKTLRNEFVFNVFSTHEELFNFTSTTPVYRTHILSGFNIKHHFDKFSLRAGYNYYESDYTFHFQTQQDFNHNEGSVFGHMYRLGIEKTFNSNAIQYYAGAEIILNSSAYSGITEGSGDFNPYYKLPYSFKSTYFGISPLAGLKYRFSQKFAISFEAAFSIIRYQTYRASVYESRKGSELLTYPIRTAGLSYYF